MKVFLSSTALDLVAYRKVADDTILRMSQEVVVMERFGPLPGEPVAECERKARECDVLVCIVAHRYGLVPDKGRGSITRREVDAAKTAGGKCCPDRGGRAPLDREERAGSPHRPHRRRGARRDEQHARQSQIPALYAYVAAKAVYRAEALRVVCELETIDSHDFLAALNLAVAWTAIGDHNRAFVWLERAYKKTHLPVESDHRRAGIRAAALGSGYADLVRRMGL